MTPHKYKTIICKKCGATFVPDNSTNKADPICQFCLKSHFPLHKKLITIERGLRK